MDHTPVLRIALVIFSKTPENPNAKTRLRIPKLDQQLIQRLHAQFVTTTADLVTSDLNCQSYAYWLGADTAESQELRALQTRFPRIQHEIQVGDTFAQRFENMRIDIQKKGFAACVVIGTDCPSLSKKIIQQALSALQTGHDGVYGPAQRGGLYLIGFLLTASAIAWEKLFAESDQQRAFEDRFSNPFKLPPLMDVDLPEDILLLKKQPVEIPQPVRNTLDKIDTACD